MWFFFIMSISLLILPCIFVSSLLLNFIQIVPFLDPVQHPTSISGRNSSLSGIPGKGIRSSFFSFSKSCAVPSEACFQQYSLTFLSYALYGDPKDIYDPTQAYTALLDMAITDNNFKAGPNMKQAMQETERNILKSNRPLVLNFTS
jgi:hypothetical protein